MKSAALMSQVEKPIMKQLCLLLAVFIAVCSGTIGCSRKPKTAPTSSSSGSTDGDRVESEAAKETVRSRDASDEFFDSDTIPELKIEIPEGEMRQLRENSKAYVRCTIRENDDVVYKSVGVKLKGAAGSFREIDDRPALTLNMDKYAKGKNKKQSFHGMDKLHLNNSVQDESYLNELICSELCRSAGIATPRVGHARVWINERDLGLYVLKEGFDKKFLKRHFADASGNLYDGGFLQDIDVDLEKDSGDGDDDRSDLHALKAACEEPEPEKRWPLVEERLDVDKFLTFVALEMMTCHWDGYSINKNNYRIYFDPTNHKAFFLPHGMDQMFGDPGASVLDQPGTIVAATVMQNPKWRAQYRERLRELLPLFAPADKLIARVDAVQPRLRSLLEALSPEQAQGHDDRVRELRERLVARAENLKEQVNQEDPKPPEFDEHNVMLLADWYGASECEDAMHEEVDVPGEPPRKAYLITCGPSGRCVASWRRKVLLAKGRYELVVEAKTSDVDALEDDRGSGVGIRISGAMRSDKLEGTTDWTSLKFEFDVLEEIREVEMVIEMKSVKGKVWFDRETLKLKRLVSRKPE